MRLRLPIWSAKTFDRSTCEPRSPSGQSGSWGYTMRIAPVLVFALLSGCTESRLDQASGLKSRTVQSTSAWSEERKAIYEQAREGLRLSRERYLETTRPVLQRKFRQEYPTLGETELEILVNDALGKGFRPETTRQPERPIRLPPMHCLPSTWGSPTQTNCY